MIASGCGRVGHQDSSEQKSRLMIKAYQMEDKGNYDAAIALCKKELEAYPLFARPHLDLAMLLHDRKQDYIAAIYHYKKYLEMRPTTEKKDLILKRIKEAEDAFVGSRVAERNVEARTVAEMEKAYAKLRNQNMALSNKLAKVQGELYRINEDIRKKYRDSVVGNDGGLSAEKQPPVAENAGRTNSASSRSTVSNRKDNQIKGTAKNRRSSSKKRLPIAKPHPTTYVVRRGDTLSKIAKRMYHDGNKWTKIRDANKRILGNKDTVQVGQKLIIP